MKNANRKGLIEEIEKMKSKRIHNKVAQKEKRRELRANMTPAEVFLWKHLKARKLDGKRFTRQHGFGNYIVDFYCASQKLIVELDGEVHNNPSAQEYDEKRTAYLNGLGYTMIRFENNMVFDFLKSVLTEIKDNFKNET